MLILATTSLSTLLLPFMGTSYIWHLSISSLFLLALYSILFIFPASAYSTFYTSTLFIDFLSIPLITLTLWISALMILASYLTLFKKMNTSIFLLCILSLNSILILTFAFSNLILLYIFFEASLIPTLFLILGWGYQPERLQAGFYLILYTVAASLPLMMNLLSIYFMNKSISLTNYFWFPSTTPSMFFIWWFTLILAFLVKMPLYMFHLWLPKAHVEAPIAGSMILAGILLKLGSYGLIRLASLFPYINTILLPSIGALAMWGAVLTSMICTRQPDMKSLIAYSSVGHMGLLTAGAMTSTSWGWEGSLLMMTAHGLCSSALFAIANFTYETTHTRSIFLTKGLLTLFPAMSIAWFLLSAANMAAPPTLNLISEIILLSSVLSSSITMALSIGALSFLAAVYSLFLFTATQHGQLSNFMSPLNMFSMRYTLLLYLHMAPLFLLALKADFVLNWSLF